MEEGKIRKNYVAITHGEKTTGNIYAASTVQKRERRIK